MFFYIFICSYFFLLLEKTHPCLVMDSALTFLTWQLLSMINAFHDLLIHEILVLCIMRTCLLSSFCSICNSACLTRPKESLLCPYDLSSVFALKHLVILLLRILGIIALSDNSDGTAHFASLKQIGFGNSSGADGNK